MFSIPSSAVFVLLLKLLLHVAAVIVRFLPLAAWLGWMALAAGNSRVDFESSYVFLVSSKVSLISNDSNGFVRPFSPPQNRHHTTMDNQISGRE